VKRDAPEDAKAHDGEAGKLEKYFSANPGEGD
jgi:ferredoxin